MYVVLSFFVGAVTGSAVWLLISAFFLKRRRWLFVTAFGVHSVVVAALFAVSIATIRAAIGDLAPLTEAEQGLAQAGFFIAVGAWLVPALALGPLMIIEKRMGWFRPASPGQSPVGPHHVEPAD